MNAARHWAIRCWYGLQYVLGGQGMEIAGTRMISREFMRIIGRYEQEHPVLVDKVHDRTGSWKWTLSADGEDVLIPGIMEHIEARRRALRDSISVYPARRITEKQQRN